MFAILNDTNSQEIPKYLTIQISVVFILSLIYAQYVKILKPKLSLMNSIYLNNVSH